MHHVNLNEVRTLLFIILVRFSKSYTVVIKKKLPCVKIHRLSEAKDQVMTT